METDEWQNVFNGCCGVIYIGAGVLFGSFSFSDPWPWNAAYGVACFTNCVGGALLLSRAYRNAYR